MSSQILVHGYIEIPEGSERENVAMIASLRAGPRYFVYAYGPLGGSEEHVWIRVPQTRTLGAEELVLESANGRTRGPLG